MSNAFILWSDDQDNHFHYGSPDYVVLKARPLTEDEVARIKDDPFIKAFKPKYEKGALLIKMNPKKHYGDRGAGPLLTHLRLLIAHIVGGRPLPANLQAPVIDVGPGSRTYSSAPARFQFSFSGDDLPEEQEVHYGFRFLDKHAKLREYVDSQPDTYMDFLGRMEEYGVHDGWGDDEVAVGFSSYEVAPEKRWEVVERWKAFFENRGYATGEIEEIKQEQDA